MKNYIIISLTLACLLTTTLLLFSFKTKSDSTPDVYMQVTTVESIIPGGLGRSKMLIVDENGTSTEMEMENFYSMVGINFGNITANNKRIVTKINELCSKGWELDEVSTGVQSPTDDKQGIYLTRYLFKKKK